jgi:hypothetical protein
LRPSLTLGIDHATDRAEGITVTSDQNIAPEAYASGDDEVEYYVPVAWQAITSLVIGIVSILLITRYGGTGLFALAFGADALWRIDRGMRTGKGLAIAGIVLGGVALAVALIGYIS